MYTNPLITIYIITYNRVALLERAIKSVITQTYTNLEIIIVDDCSTDNTMELLQKYSERDSRITFFQNITNSGACVSRNKAILEAKGTFITGLDDDDYFTSNRIEKFIQAWTALKDENVLFLYSNYIKKNTTREKMAIHKESVIRSDLLYGNHIGNQIFIKTVSLQKNLFDENLKMWQDLDCWYRLLHDNKKAININGHTYVVDLSHESTRISNNKEKTLLETYHYLVEKYQLKKSEKCLFKTHIYAYNIHIKLTDITHLFLCHKSVKVLFILVKKYIKMYKNI